MTTLPPSRLATLPGYDTAPDIYETPAQTTDTDATTTSTRSPSNTSASENDTTDSDDNAESEVGGTVSRRRISASRARRRFEGEGRGVSVRGVDLSDRVDGGRRGYGLRFRPDEERLEEKIARLRREMEECRVLSEKAGGDDGGEVDGLGKILAGLEGRGRVAKGDVVEDGEHDDDESDGDEKMLKDVANFDSRLASLETALGLSALDTAATTDAALTMPLLPSLTLLDQRLAALSSATSLAQLEAASSRIRRLRQEADTSLSEPATTTNGTHEDDATEDAVTALSPADLDQLRKLYAVLPSIQTLTPTIPALLTRLRSLRTLHSTAAAAATSIEDVERRQAEMEGELKAWREGLAKVENAIEGAQEANGRNGKVVEKWVKELEERMKALGR